VDQAEGVLASALGAEAARQRLAERRQEVVKGRRQAEAARNQARKEAKLFADLDKAREQLSNWRGRTFDYESADQSYAEAVAAYGLDVFGPEPGAVAAAIQKERPAVRLALIVALDHWAMCAGDKVRAPRLREVAGLADGDGWRRLYRAALAGGHLDELKRLAIQARDKSLSAVSIDLLARALVLKRSSAEAVQLLRWARSRHPEDFWIHHNLGNLLHDPAHPGQATLDEALSCFWTAVALRPDSAPARVNLGNALLGKGLVEEAIGAYHKAIDLAPRFAPAHTNLGVVLAAAGRLEAAIAEHRKAIDIDPRHPQTHFNLGLALHDNGQLEEAIAAYHKAIDLDPKYSPPHNNLGNALHDKGRPDEAIAEYHKAIELDHKNAEAHTNLGHALYVKGRLDEAIAEHRQAIALAPKLAVAHNNLGGALAAKGRLDEAIAEHRQAIALSPKNAKAYGALGVALLRRGRFVEARDVSRQALELLPVRDPLRAQVTQVLQWCEGLMKLDAKRSAILKGDAQPADNAERLQLADLCRRFKKHYVAAVGFFSDAFAAEPRLAGDMRFHHRYNAACAAALASAGKGEDAGKLDGKERTRLRRQALDWLRADFAAYAKLAEKDDKAARKLVRQRLTLWQKDADLETVREEKAFPKLPGPERQAWRQFWADVAALRKKCQ
jgi:tetratricopeptide (TPR) repeat protein